MSKVTASSSSIVLVTSEQHKLISQLTGTSVASIYIFESSENYYILDSELNMLEMNSKPKSGNLAYKHMGYIYIYIYIYI